MDNIDLSRLNPIAFERLIRALCFATMGPAGTVYSSGPDGGRDFTYDGSIAGYEGRRWKGYLVVQAKFKDPSSSSIDDIQWLQAQLRNEFNKYAFPGSRLKKPQYYIIVTNIKLSGADSAKPKTGTKKRSVGGYSKAKAILEGWRPVLGLKDFDIWPHDKIVDLLIAHPEIRQSYANWTTSGDVLAKALEHFKATRADFGEVASRSLKISLQRDQFVRLKDAGSVGDPQIRTSQVIVDLPLTRYDEDSRLYLRDLKDEDQDVDYHVPDNAIARLADRAREKLDPDTLLADEDRLDKAKRVHARNRIVLIGGPGQGKSTASLFLAQIFRAAILQNQPATRRDHAVKHLVPEILKRAGNESISVSLPPRFPLHISLPRFADSISVTKQTGGNLPSLLAHIAAEISACADQQIERSDLRNWLRHYPWLLVLDGLDEVPPTGERPAILEAVSTFFTEVSEVNADVLVVVTTRPQGYNKDFDENLWEHWRLADLESADALRYAKAFGEARYPDDAPRRNEVHKALRKAASQPATARLMVSPLQVTILHFIIDTGGGVPTARWTLFNEYFEVLKRREKAKGGELQKYLERHWGHLGPIHHRAGLVLQTDSEHGGGARSRFTQERFRQLVKTYLLSEGFSEDDLTLRVDELMELALNRLVLLSQQEEGNIMFDVRSLQEFMAAAAMTSADQQIMQDRLDHIAGHSHWRHVFQIAASRCFADDTFHYRRATITAIAREIDVVEPDMLVKNGARLALDLLSDGIGLDHPISRRALLQHALELVDLGPAALDARLAKICDATNADLFESHVAQRILEGKSAPAICAWKLLLQINQLGHAWTENLIIKLWPTDRALQLQIIEQISLPLGSQLILDHLTRVLSTIGPALGIQVYNFSQDLMRMRKDDRLDYSRLRNLSFARFYLGRAETHAVRLLDDEFPGVYSVRINSVDAGTMFEGFRGPDFAPEVWSGLRACADYGDDPSLSSAANILIGLANLDTRLARSLARFMPWPIALALIEADNESDLRKIADEVASGVRGTIQDWKRAEDRWEKRGIVRSDLLIKSAKRRLDSDIVKMGAPFWIPNYGTSAPDSVRMILELKRIADEASNPQIAVMLREVASIISVFGEMRAWPPEFVADLLRIALGIRSRFRIGDVLDAIPEESWSALPEIQLIAEVVERIPDEELMRLKFAKLLWRAHSIFPNSPEIWYPLTVAVFSEDTEARQYLAPLVLALKEHDLGHHPFGNLALVALRLVECSESQIEKHVRAILSMRCDPDQGLLKLMLMSEVISLERRIAILSAIIIQSRESGSRWRDFISPMLRALDSRKSGLTRADMWKDKLSLPSESFSVLLPVTS